MGTYRVRSQGGSSTATESYGYTLCNGTVFSSTRSIPNSIEDSKVTKDFVTPNFRALSAQGGIVNNPFSVQRVRRIMSGFPGWHWTYTPTCSGTTQRYQWGQTHRGLMNDSVIASVPRGNLAPLSSELAAIAGTQAAANVLAPEFQSQVFAGEFRETLRLLRNPMSQLRDLVSTARRRGALVAASGEYLKYRYGILPLVSDIHSISKALTSSDVVKPVRLTARGAASDSDSSAGSPYSVSDSLYSGTIVCTSSLEISVRAGILYEHSADWRNDFGFSPSDVPSAAWELLPYSFIADWFVNFGDWIRAVTPKAGVRVLATWTTNKTILTHSFQGNIAPKSVANYSIGGNCGGNILEYSEELTRTPGISVRLAVKPKPLDLGTDRGRTHVADLSALIAQKLR